MTTPILTMGTTLTCPHGIPVTVPATGAKVLIAGTPVAVDGDKGIVAGCPFTTPEPKPQPCTKVDFSKTTQSVEVSGSKVLLVNADECKSGEISNGPAIVSGPQTKVLAK